MPLLDCLNTGLPDFRRLGDSQIQITSIEEVYWQKVLKDTKDMSQSKGTEDLRPLPTSSSAGGWSQGSEPVSFPLEGAGPLRLRSKAGLSSSHTFLKDFCFK